MKLVPGGKDTSKMVQIEKKTLNGSELHELINFICCIIIKISIHFPFIN